MACVMRTDSQGNLNGYNIGTPCDQPQDDPFNLYSSSHTHMGFYKSLVSLESNNL